MAIGDKKAGVPAVGGVGDWASCCVVKASLKGNLGSFRIDSPRLEQDGCQGENRQRRRGEQEKSVRSTEVTGKSLV